MIISDLNYLEIAEASAVVGGYGDFKFDKKLNSEQNNTVNFFNTTKIKEDIDIYKKIKADSDVKGNSTLLLVDAEAVGKNTVSEVETSNLSIAGKLSSIGLKVVTAANY